MKHTPGPWSINNWPQGDSQIAIGAVGTPLIAKAFLRDVSINQQKANARLIAAAPELLAVAQQAAEAIKHVRQVRAAWSPAQVEAFLNGVEKSARVAIENAIGEVSNG